MQRPAREQQAWEEVGQTEIRRSVAAGLAGLGLGSLLVVPLLSTHASPFASFTTGRELRAEMLAFEAALEDASWLQRAALPAVQSVLTGWGRVGNEQVYVGHDGWLFFRPDVELLTGAVSSEPALEALLDFHRQLAAREIALIVMPVPPKTAVVPRRLARGAPDPRQHPLVSPAFTELLHRLETAGVVVFDPTKTLLATSAEPYLRTDSHWRPEAMDAVACELARRLETLGLGPRRLELRRESLEITGRGDLVRMLDLSWPETAVVERVVDGDHRPWQSDPAAEVLLLGDSFTNVFAQPGLGWGEAGGLAEQLSFHLGRPVDRLAINDGGDLEARRQLAQDLAAGRDRLAGKRAVVYQFAARELVTGDWQPVALPAVRAATPSVVVRVRATLAARAELPAPGTTPYREALVAVHLREVEALGGENVAREVLAYAWGLRDGRPAAAAGWRRGQQLELRLVPWSQAPSELESLQRIELPSEELLFLDTFWVETDDEKND